MILAIFTFISACSATPGPLLEQSYLRQLTRAANAREVERVQAAFENLKVVRLACRMQMLARTVPVSCYETLKQESIWKLATGESGAARERELDERCRKATIGLRLPAPATPLENVSRFCRAAILEARGIERYRDPDPDKWSGN